MKNKIFNAIQKGLSNVLVFDNDSSIVYQKADVNNEIEFSVTSLDELYDIFKDCNKSIFNYNTKNCLILILDNEQEISLHEYKSNMRPIFLKISNDILKQYNNEIIIACDNNHYITANDIKWQTIQNQILPNGYMIKNKHTVINDFDGYLKTQLILNNTKNNPELGNALAAEYCNNIKSPLSNYEGYLPAMGQLNLILKYLDMLNYIFEYLGFDKLNLDINWWWSSSESDNGNIWYLEIGEIYRGKHKIYYTADVLPLFAIKNETFEIN